MYILTMLYFNNHFTNVIANNKLILKNLDPSDNLVTSTLYKRMDKLFM